MKINILFMPAMVFLITWSSSSQAQYERVAGFHEHDGFFLRFHGGFGSGEIVEEGLPMGNMTLTGLAGVARFQIGSSISTNLVLFAEMGAFSMSDPQMDWGTISGTDEDVDLSISDYGGGLTYYFMPSNFYLSGTFIVSRDKFKMKGQSVASPMEKGYGAYLAVGKEYWVSGNWGLGVAGFYYFSSTTDKAAEPYPFSNTIFGVVFSATYH